MELGVRLDDLVVDPGFPAARALAEQAWMTASQAVSQRTSKISRLTFLRSDRGTWNVSRGRMPRSSGSTQKMVSAWRLSAMGKMPAA